MQVARSNSVAIRNKLLFQPRFGQSDKLGAQDLRISLLLHKSS